MRFALLFRQNRSDITAHFRRRIAPPRPKMQPHPRSPCLICLLMAVWFFSGCDKRESFSHQKLPTISFASSPAAFPRLPARWRILHLQGADWKEEKTRLCHGQGTQTLQCTPEGKKRLEQPIFTLLAFPKDAPFAALPPMMRALRHAGHALIGLRYCVRATPSSPCTPNHLILTPLPDQAAWLRERHQSPPSSQPTSAPCDRCQGSIRRKLAAIRIPPFPLPPLQTPARFILEEHQRGLDLWINGRPIHQSCNLWLNEQIPSPTLPTLPYRNPQQYQEDRLQCLRAIRKRYPLEQRILLRFPPKQSIQEVLAILLSIRQAPIQPPFDAIDLASPSQD